MEVLDAKDDKFSSIAEELYIKFRKKGLLCVDLKEGNIGKVLKDNKKPEEVSLSAINMKIYDDNFNTAKKGDYVLIDTDYVFTIKEWNELSLSSKKKYLDLSEFNIKSIFLDIAEYKIKDDDFGIKKMIKEIENR